MKIYEKNRFFISCLLILLSLFSLPSLYHSFSWESLCLVLLFFILGVFNIFVSLGIWMTRQEKPDCLDERTRLIEYKTSRTTLFTTQLVLLILCVVMNFTDNPPEFEWGAGAGAIIALLLSFVIQYIVRRYYEAHC